jgi:hypothetical protein
MNNADKLWNAFVAVAKVLPEDDLESFGRALYFGTAFKSLNKGALKVAHGLALKIGAPTTAQQVYFALAVQSWGYGDLKQIAEGLNKHVTLRELSDGNQDRIVTASNKIAWPITLIGPPVPPVAPVPLSPLTKTPRDPFALDPSEKTTTDERVASPAPILGLVAFLAVIGISLVIRRG